MKVTFLGTGTSLGIPIINCSCNVCTSNDQRNKRLRTSISIQTENTSLIIDTTPDLRQQLLRSPIPKLDAVIFTHAHADHIYGIDDLRRFNQIQKQRIPVYGDQSTISRLTGMFDYAFGNGKLNLGLPNLEANVINDPFYINELEIIPVKLLHGDQKILGFRIGDLGYCTDVSKIPNESYELLNGLDVLILGALRETEHPTHFSVNQAIEEAGKIRARKTYFVHMSHKIEHASRRQSFPPDMDFAYDGLSLNIE